MSKDLCFPGCAALDLLHNASDGIAFGCGTNRGMAGGQKADDVAIAGIRAGNPDK